MQTFVETFLFLCIYIFKNSLRATHSRHVINIGQNCLSYRFTVWLWYKFADGVEILFNGIFRLIVLKEYICGLRKPSTYIAFNVPALQIKGKISITVPYFKKNNNCLNCRNIMSE